jgi:hypothetical protein
MTQVFRNKPVFWHKDILARRRIAPELVDGRLNDRHLIEKDTPISGGAYVSENRRLIIEVNGESTKMSGIYQQFLETVGKNTTLDSICTRHFLSHVMETTRGILKNDYLDFLQTFEGLVNLLNAKTLCDTRISLDMMVEMEIADCRIYSLLSGVLIERLIEDKFILGRVSLDRNAVKGLGGHVWARFTALDGEVTIVDATNNYLGDENSDIWPYKRP